MGSMTQRYRGAWVFSDAAPSSMPPSSPKMACVGKLSWMRARIAASACLSASVTGLASAFASIATVVLRHNGLLLPMCSSLCMLRKYRVMPQMGIPAAAVCVPEELRGDRCCCICQSKSQINESVVHAIAFYSVRLGTGSHGLPCMRWAFCAQGLTTGSSRIFKRFSVSHRCPQQYAIGPASE